jgi:hypothetical protein
MVSPFIALLVTRRDRDVVCDRKLVRALRLNGLALDLALPDQPEH